MERRMHFMKFEKVDTDKTEPVYLNLGHIRAFDTNPRHKDWTRIEFTNEEYIYVNGDLSKTMGRVEEELKEWPGVAGSVVV
jgi:hypothetical protein